jgi:hypothetical protein
MNFAEIQTVNDFQNYLRTCDEDELIEFAREYVSANNLTYIPDTFKIRHLLDLFGEQGMANRALYLLITISNECTRRFAELDIRKVD